MSSELYPREFGLQKKGRYFLFTNHDFGETFQKKATDLANRYDLEFIVVFSGIERKRKLCFPNIMSWAKSNYSKWRLANRYSRDLHMPVLIVENINSQGFLRRIKKGDHGIIAGFGQIFRQPLISRFRTLVNFHPSLLPFYRGPTPTYWCIKNREKITGYTLHKVTEQIDCGEILWQDTVRIDSKDTPLGLIQKISVAAVKVFENYVLSIHTGKVFKHKLVDAFGAYQVHVKYLSFPKNS